MAVNQALLVGHGALREAVVGEDDFVGTAGLQGQRAEEERGVPRAVVNGGQDRKFHGNS